MKKELSNIEIIKLLLRHFKKSTGTKMYYFIVIFGFFISSINMIENFLFVEIINYIENFYKTGVFDIQRIIIPILYWVGFIIFYLIVAYIYRYYLVDRTSVKFYEYFFNTYSEKVLYIQYGEYLGKKSGEIYAKFSKGIKDSFNMLFFIFLEVIRNLSGIIILIIVLFIINPLMASISMLMLPVMIFMGIYFNVKTVKTQKEINDFDDKNYGILADSITNMSLVKNLTLEQKIYSTLKDNLHTSVLNQFQISKRWSISDIYTGILVMITRLLVIIVGTYLISIGKLSLAMLFLYFSFIGWIYFPLSMIFAKLRNIQEMIIHIGSFFEEFDNLQIEENNGKNNKNKSTKKTTTKTMNGNILFNDVQFGYTSGRNIFEKLNFSINSGEKIGFVGNTGAGKSTIINLLFRLWDTQGGKILLDGKNINNISKKELRKNIGVVAQDNSLFNLSIKENLLFACPKCSEQEIKDAIISANAEFVYELKDGIDTIIGERGLKLSGGEKQRISIARLFLKNPSIIILDEATSALDNKTEQLIQSSLDRLLQGKTSIIIAHRLSTIQNVDKIFMLDNGKIIETGNYQELLSKKGKFYDLVNPKHLIIN